MEGKGAGLLGAFRKSRSDPGLRREADMIGFYLSVTLLAALVAGNDYAPHTKLDVLSIVWGTTIGLAIAHWFALVVSMRLVPDPHLHHTPLEVLVSQLMMGSIIAVVATAVVLVLPESLDRFGARMTAALFIGIVVLLESRAGGSTLRRAVSLGVLALVVGMAIATVKWFIGK